MNTIKQILYGMWLVIKWTSIALWVVFKWVCLIAWTTLKVINSVCIAVWAANKAISVMNYADLQRRKYLRASNPYWNAVAPYSYEEEQELQQQAKAIDHLRKHGRIK